MCLYFNVYIELFYVQEKLSLVWTLIHSVPNMVTHSVLTLRDSLDYIVENTVIYARVSIVD